MPNQPTELVREPIPKDLLEPPEPLLDNGPVVTRPQELPFTKLSWQNFEKLVLRMAIASGDFLQCARYGRSGQSQHGIDVFARLPGGIYTCWQARNRTSITSSELSGAVEDFLQGRWANRSNRFIYCVSSSLEDTILQDLIEEEATRLLDRGIEFVTLDGIQLSVKLKSHPRIVDDFFGRDWVKAFCGESAAKGLRRRLDASRVNELRRGLAGIYKSWFHVLDSGLTMEDEIPTTFDIREHFVLPDVDPERPFNEPIMEYSEPNSEIQMPQDDHWRFDKFGQTVSLPGVSQDSSEQYETPRIAIEEWLLQDEQTQLILGPPGSGKSTVLRCLALDLLQAPELFPRMAERLGAPIPLHIPFALWSRLSETMHRVVGLPEVVEAAFGAVLLDSELEDSIIQALSDERLLLLIDGLDEYRDQQAARTTLATIESFVRTHHVQCVMTARASGIRNLDLPIGHWKTARLADLTSIQQQELATKLLSQTEDSSSQ